MVQGFKALADFSGVFAGTEDPVVLSSRHIQQLLVEAEKTNKKRARLLLHQAIDDALHEMVIALPKESFDRPHINFKSGKSFTALHGIFAVVLFSDLGEMLPPVLLSENGSLGNVMVRLNKPVWHTIVPIHGPCVFLETILGPFEGNRFAPFSPEIHDARSFADFANGVRHQVYEAIFSSLNGYNDLKK